MFQAHGGVHDLFYSVAHVGSRVKGEGHRAPPTYAVAFDATVPHLPQM